MENYRTVDSMGKGCSYNPTAFPPSMAVMLSSSLQGCINGVSWNILPGLAWRGS
ncbi:MAG: hypothetical protein V3R76_06340 [Gammaproteobacteria bacterium]